MRIIRFRVKCAANGRWEYYTLGDLVSGIAKNVESLFNAETWGQSTELVDKNGIYIYEGDIIRAKNWNPSEYIVEYIDGAFCATAPLITLSTDINYFYDSTGCSIEVIGNIHDKP